MALLDGWCSFILVWFLSCRYQVSRLSSLVCSDVVLGKHSQCPFPKRHVSEREGLKYIFKAVGGVSQDCIVHAPLHHPPPPLFPTSKRKSHPFRECHSMPFQHLNLPPILPHRPYKIHQSKQQPTPGQRATSPPRAPNPPQLILDCVTIPLPNPHLYSPGNPQRNRDAIIDHRINQTSRQSLMFSWHMIGENNRGSRKRHIHSERHDDDGDEHVGPVDLVDGLEGCEELADEEC